MTTAVTETIDIKRDRMVIIASSLGTMFEWYDFFVYAMVAKIIADTYFPSASPTASLLLALLTFGIGFGVRPFGAAIFGVIGDKLGRKFTFLITISLMGFATAALGLIPGYKTLGMAAPIILVLLRALQGLALGGEYGGAAIYVGEHAPRNRRGLYTSFIQASVFGGMTLSLFVVLSTSALVGKQNWQDWGWRIPFLISLVLLAISLWIRFKLNESPVFKAMKEAGETARNPLAESFNSGRKTWRILAVMMGVAAGLTVIWYTAQLYALSFLQDALRIDDRSAQAILMVGACFSLFWFVLFGWLSDLYGRKRIILLGYGLTLLTLFPLFHIMADAGNPQLTQAMKTSPIVVTGSDCSYSVFATAQATACGKLMDILQKKGLPFHTNAVAAGTAPSITIASVAVDAHDDAKLNTALKAAGYKLEKGAPHADTLWKLVLAIIGIGMLSGMSYGPVAAYLVELFPARVRYTSLSIPYHVGAGYFGGFLPFITKIIIIKTGDPFAGLWYTVGITALAMVVMIFCLPETSGKELD